MIILWANDQQSSWWNSNMSQCRDPSSRNYLVIAPQSNRKNCEDISRKRPGSLDFLAIDPQSNRKNRKNRPPCKVLWAPRAGCDAGIAESICIILYKSQVISRTSIIPVRANGRASLSFARVGRPFFRSRVREGLFSVRAGGKASLRGP